MSSNVKAIEMKLNLKALRRSYKLQMTATKDKFLTSQNQRWQIFGVSYLLAPSAECISLPPRDKSCSTISMGQITVASLIQ